MEKKVPVVELKEGDIFIEEVLPGSRAKPLKLRVISAETFMHYNVMSVVVRTEALDWPTERHPQMRFRRTVIPANGEVVVEIAVPENFVWANASDLRLNDKIKISPASPTVEVRAMSLACGGDLAFLVENEDFKTFLTLGSDALVLKEPPAVKEVPVEKVSELVEGWKKIKAKHINVGDIIRTGLGEEFVVVMRDYKPVWFGEDKIEFELAPRDVARSHTICRTANAEHNYMVLILHKQPPKCP